MIDNKAKQKDLLITEIHKLVEGKSIGDIINFETDNIYNKSAASVIIKRHIIRNGIFDMDVLKEYQISLKFIPVDLDYKCYEAMSFSTTSLSSIIFEDWDSEDPLMTSSLRNQLGTNFLFIPIIKTKSKGTFNNYMNWRVGDFSLWKPDDNELKMIGIEWNTAKAIIKSGVKLQEVAFGNSYRTTNNLPKQSETSYIHLRPHAKNSYDHDLQYKEFTNGEIEITKQSFWLNKKYINSLLKDYRWKTSLKEE